MHRLRGGTPRPEQNGLCTPCLLSLGLAATGDSIDSKAASAPSSATDPPLVSGFSVRSFGDYELLEEIARGGMGVVYQARQTQPEPDRRGEDDPGWASSPSKQIVQRFRGEAAAAALLQHPNIVAIHEVGMHDGQHFFSMDYVEGQNLAQLVGNRPLPPARRPRATSSSSPRRSTTPTSKASCTGISSRRTC